MCKASVCLLCKAFYLTGPSVSKDSGDINRGVCHNGVVVEFLLALSFVLNLSTTKTVFVLSHADHIHVVCLRPLEA